MHLNYPFQLTKTADPGLWAKSQKKVMSITVRIALSIQTVLGESGMGPRIKRMCDQGAFGSSARRDFLTFPLFAILLCWFAGTFLTASMHAQQKKDDPQIYGERPLPAPAFSALATARTRIAEGEYAIYEQANSGAFGPFGEEIYDFHESWTLWRTEKGQYRVEGERKFESPRYTTHANRFLVELSRDMTAIRMTELAHLEWRRDSGPLSCEFLVKELHCSSGARDPHQSIDLHIPMEDPFGLWWPISPFSLSSLTRQSERDTARGTPVQLLSIEQPSAALPVRPMILGGQLQYLGEENIDAAEQKWRAHKFSLKVASHPQFLIWTSSIRLLLALAIEHPHPNWPQEGMRLVRFKKWADFSEQGGP
jgi:hypothetical protein